MVEGLPGGAAGRLADQDRAPVVLEGHGEILRRRIGRAVDQDQQAPRVGVGLRVGCRGTPREARRTEHRGLVPPLGLVGEQTDVERAALGPPAIGKRHQGAGQRLGSAPALVAAHVDDQAGGIAGRLHIGHGALLEGGVEEARDAEVGQPLLQATSFGRHGGRGREGCAIHGEAVAVPSRVLEGYGVGLGQEERRQRSEERARLAELHRA